MAVLWCMVTSAEIQVVVTPVTLLIRSMVSRVVLDFMFWTHLVKQNAQNIQISRHTNVTTLVPLLTQIQRDLFSKIWRWLITVKVSEQILKTKTMNLIWRQSIWLLEVSRYTVKVPFLTVLRTEVEASVIRLISMVSCQAVELGMVRTTIFLLCLHSHLTKLRVLHHLEQRLNFMIWNS